MLSAVRTATVLPKQGYFFAMLYFITLLTVGGKNWKKEDRRSLVTLTFLCDVTTQAGRGINFHCEKSGKSWYFFVIFACGLVLNTGMLAANDDLSLSLSFFPTRNKRDTVSPPPPPLFPQYFKSNNNNVGRKSYGNKFLAGYNIPYTVLYSTVRTR